MGICSGRVVGEYGEGKEGEGRGDREWKTEGKLSLPIKFSVEEEIRKVEEKLKVEKEQVEDELKKRQAEFEKKIRELENEMKKVKFQPNFRKTWNLRGSRRSKKWKIR